MRPLLGLSLCLLSIAACGDDTGPASDGHADAASQSSSACTGIAQSRPCPSSCPETFTTDRSAWCFKPDAGMSTPVLIATDCSGYDIVDYMGVDTADYVVYRASDKQLLGVQHVDANRMTHTCVTGVPDTFDASQCSNLLQRVQCFP